MQPLTSEQQKKLLRLAKVVDNGDIALLEEIQGLEGKIEALEGQIPDVQKALDRVEALVDGEKGEDGDDYILTEEDKKEIASLIPVPIVERVVERKQIIREKPIITKEITKEIVKEIREVKVDVPYIDNASIAYLEDEIKRVENLKQNNMREDMMTRNPEYQQNAMANYKEVLTDIIATLVKK